MKRLLVWQFAVSLAGASAWAVSPLSLLDPTFQIGTGANGAVDAVAVQTNGSILIGGAFTQLNNRPTPRIARLLENGTVDPSFQVGTGASGEVTRLRVLADGKILVTGAFTNFNGVTRAGIVRLNDNGSVDTAFDPGSGNGGVADPLQGVYSLAPQSNDRWLIGGGFQHWDGATRKGLARLSADGALDTGYAKNTAFDGIVMVLLPLPDGSTLAGGQFLTVNGVSRPALVRIKSDGSFDSGKSFGLDPYSSVFAMVLLPDESILVGGDLLPTGLPDATLMRLQPDLSVDTSFKPPTLTPGGGTPISALLLQNDGRVVCGGYFLRVDGWWRRLITRLNADWTVDECFDPALGLGGNVTGSPVRSLALDARGRILVGGAFPGFDGILMSGLVRLLPSGPCGISRLQLLQQDATHAVVYATTPPKQTNVLEVSTDLTNWLPVRTNLDSVLSFPIAIDTNDAHPSYRLRGYPKQ